MTRDKRNRKCKRPWPEVFHVAIAPRLGLAGLQALQAALDSDDAALIQGETCLPDFMSVSRDLPCRAACGLGLALWRSLELRSIGEIDLQFSLLVNQVDGEMGQGAARMFVQWFDETPRATMRRQLLKEVNRAVEHETLAPLLRNAHGEGGAA
jgi:hypothetical protein